MIVLILDLCGLSLNFSVLDLRSFTNLCMARTSPPGSLASPTSTDGLRSLYCLLQGRAWNTRLREFSALIGVWMPWLVSPLSTTTTTGVSWVRYQGRFPLRPLLLDLCCACFCVIFFFWLICCFPLPMFTHVIVFGSL